MSKYSTANKKVFERVLAKKVEAIKALISKALDESASDILKDVETYTIMYPTDNGGYLPIYSGNLFDSTGVGTYEDSVLTRYHPRRMQSPFEGRNTGGSSDLSEALSKGVTEYRVGLWLVVFSSADYAGIINDGDFNSAGGYGKIVRGEGYFDRIKDATSEIVRRNKRKYFPKN